MWIAELAFRREPPPPQARPPIKRGRVGTPPPKVLAYKTHGPSAISFDLHSVANNDVYSAVEGRFPAMVCAGIAQEVKVGHRARVWRWRGWAK